MAKRTKPDEHLIAPAEAIKRICFYVGSEWHAKQVIADGIHSGSVTVYAGRVLERAGGDPTDPWDAITDKAELISAAAEMDVDHWRVSQSWPDETRFWDWEAGNFLVTVGDEDEEQPLRRYVEGARFHRTDIMTLVGRTDRSGAGGRKPDREKWADFWIDFVRAAVGTSFDWSKFDNPHQLKQMMLDFAMQEPDGSQRFADSNIDFAVAAAWEGLVLRQARERKAAS